VDSVVGARFEPSVPRLRWSSVQLAAGDATAAAIAKPGTPIVRGTHPAGGKCRGLYPIESVPCQGVGEPPFPYFSTLPGGQLSALASRLPVSGGGWRVRGTRASWWRSMSVWHCC